MHGGYIKVWRKMLDSEVMQDDWMCRLWVWCMLKARWQESQRDDDAKRGQFHTGRIRASDELKVSPSKWYRGIQRLKDIGCIEIEVNSNRTTITVCNFSTYQDSIEESEQQTDSKRTAGDTTNEQPTDNLSLLEEGKNERTAKNQDFELTDAGLADEWVFYSTAHAGREKRDKPNGILPMIQQTLASGIGRESLRDAIRAKRNRNEWYSDFERRVMAAAGVGNGKGKFTDAELLGSMQRFVDRGKEPAGGNG